MPPALVAFQALQIGSPLRHETRAASPDARATPPRLPMVLGRVRALFASPAGGIRVADYSLGAVGLVQPNSPIGALHQVRRQRRNPRVGRRYVLAKSLARYLFASFHSEVLTFTQ